MTRNACLAGTFWVLQAVAAAAQTPSGGPFQVDSYTSQGQYFPSIAMAPGGAFVVAWPSPSDGSDYGIRQTRFDAQGNPLGGGAAVNTYTSGTQWYPAVASNPDGRFAVVWQSEGEDGSGAGIFGRIYDETGAPAVAPFRINAYTTGNQAWPSVDMDDVGNVKIVYQSEGEDGGGSAIMYQLLNWNGTEAQRFLVNTSTIANQTYPSSRRPWPGAPPVASWSRGRARMMATATASSPSATAS